MALQISSLRPPPHELPKSAVIRLSLVPPVAATEPEPAPPAKHAFAGAATLNKSIVSAYKTMGFAILATILAGLASFIVTHVFYSLDNRWITPTVLSASDPRVVALRSSYAGESAHRDALLAQVYDLEARRKDAARIVRTEEAYEAKYRLAAAADLGDRERELGKIAAAEREYSGAVRELSAAGTAWSGVSKERLADEYSSHLIDRDSLLSGSYQLTQIASSRVLLGEHQAETEAKIADLRRVVSSLSSAASGRMAADRTVSYEILKMTRDFDQSELARQKARDDQEAIDKTLAVLNKTLADYDRLLADIKTSPYLMAVGGDIPLALVPYENAGAMAQGAPVYACRAGLVVCRKVGRVAETIDGEVVGRHPLLNKDMRGRMVRLALDEPGAIQSAVLHVGHAPLFL